MPGLQKVREAIENREMKLNDDKFLEKLKSQMSRGQSFLNTAYQKLQQCVAPPSGEPVVSFALLREAVTQLREFVIILSESHLGSKLNMQIRSVDLSDLE